MLLSLIGMILLSEAAVAAGTKIIASPEPDAVWIKIILIFHRPKFDCKSGFGICLDFSAGIDKMAMPSSNGCPVLMKINEQKQLLIQVTEDNLILYENGTTLPFFKDKATITLEDSCTFPSSIGSELGAINPVIIRPGKYPVTYENKTYTVTIPL